MKHSLLALLPLVFIINCFAGPGVQFVFKTEGPIRCAPLINGSTIFFGSGDKKFYAVNKDNGAKLWDFETGGAVFSSAAIVGNTVFFTSRDNYLYALNATTGKLTWKFQFGETLGDKSFWDYYLSSPIADGDMIYVGSGDGNLYAMMAKSGKVKWKYNAKSRIRRSIAIDETTVLFGTQKGQVIALDKSGKERWIFSSDGVNIPFETNGLDNSAIYTIPVIKDGYVAVAGRDFILYLLDLKTGKEVWRYAHPNSWVLSTDIHNNKVFGGSGVAAFIHANDLKTGKVLWRFKTASPIYASYTFANDLMYFTDMLTGNVYGLDPETGKQKWLFPMGHQSFSTPVVSGEIVYCASDEGLLYAVNGTTGKNDAFVNARRIVYYEGNKSDSAFHYLNFGIDAWIRDYLVRQGYELINSPDKLAAFMNSKLDGAARTVVVFSDNKVPNELVEEESDKALIRRYLNAGGKVVFMSTANPLFFLTDPKSGVLRSAQNLDRASKVFDIKFPTQDFGAGFYYSPYTKEGQRLGLLGYTKAYWPLDPKQITTALALDENGKTPCWIKNYGGPDGSGLMTFSFVPVFVLPDFFPMRAAIEYGITW
jgi:WD40 repeat protein